ncbi:MAG: 30S ribosomal protein S4e [Candidatus Diapherotrites archaeon]
MAKRGERKVQKAISAPKIVHVNRKQKEFVPKIKPGTHSKKSAVTLGFCLKDILRLAKNTKETKAIVSSGLVLVNGIVRKKMSFNVGLFDIIELPKLKIAYRAIVDKKGRLKLKETQDKGFKVSRVEKKRKAKKGKVIVTTNDGFNIEVPEKEVFVGDSIKLSLPEKKFLETYRLEVGNKALIVDGSHVGIIGKITKIIEGSINRRKAVELETKEGKIVTIAKNVYVVGKENPEIEVLKGE